MTKQEQIEEIGRIICGRCENGICLIDKCRCDGLCEEVKAEAIYNADYRKIDKARKETAEKIYTKIKDSFLMNSNNRYALKLWIEEQFGLEIKE